MTNRYLLLSILIILASLVFAEGTPEGERICNTAYITYTDSRGHTNYEEFSDSACIEVEFDASIEIAPDHYFKTGYLENEVYFSHLLFNHGNGEDTIEITPTNEDSWDVRIHRDVNMNGILETEDIIYDPDLISVDMDDSIGIIVVVEIGDDDEDWGIVSQTEIIASSRRAPAVADSAYDTTYVVGPQLSLDLDADIVSPATVGAGDEITYTLQAENSDSSAARLANEVAFSIGKDENLLFIDDFTMPDISWLIEYFVAGTWGGAFNEDADSVRFSITGDDSIGVAELLEFEWKAKVVECPEDSILASVHGTYEDTTYVHDYDAWSDTVVTDINSPAVSIAADDTLQGNIGDTITYEMTITNEGDVTDQYLIELVEGEWGEHPIYVTDCDGDLESTEMSEEDTITGTIMPSAESCITIFVEVPDTLVFADDEVQIIVTSTENLCISDTVDLVFQQIIPEIRVNKDIIDETGDYTDTDNSVIPSDTIEYAIKFWNMEEGLADSVVISDTLDYYTQLLLGVDELTFKHLLPEAATNSDDWIVEYSTDNGATYTSYDYLGSGAVEPDVDGDPVILRIREIGSGKIEQADPVPADGTEDDVAGQGEFRFKVRLR